MTNTTKKTLVLGASANPNRYSYLVVNKLRKLDYPVVAIGKKAGQVADIAIETGMTPIENVDTVTLYLNASNQKEYYDFIFSLHPKRLIFNPGAENKELHDLAIFNGIQPMEACTLVMLSTGQY